MKPTGMTIMSYSWTYTTWPDPDTAEAAAERLLEERLCACANIIRGMNSVYRWQGKVETALETVMILKTQGDIAPTLCARIVELHPYDEPCVLNLPVDPGGSAAGFLAWIDSETGGKA